MRTRQLLGVLALLALLASCGESGGDAGPPRERVVPEDRARQVAEAWRGSDAAEQWRTGFFPLQELVRIPDDAWHTGDDKRAYAAARFTTEGDLPGGSGRGRITWTSGGTPLDVEVVPADRTLDLLGRSEQPGKGPRLTVTGARLDRLEVLTSRGPAQVPAWHYTVKGYGKPLIRAAVAADAVAKAPIGPLLEESDRQRPLEGLKSVAGDGRSLTVLAGHGACDDGPAVTTLETDESVVLSASVRGADDGPCTAQLLVEELTVRLQRPLGERVLLDAFTGVPVELKARHTAG
ncbi:hypothetical protein ACIBI4_05780 [Streptomyces sp. NPDC050418]|uniref:hypothetical protein n=1 Tax=Streptomyces sp. NPDC050418 TaxID=3365612 RepID=UPI003787AB77